MPPEAPEPAAESVDAASGAAPAQAQEASVEEKPAEETGSAGGETDASDGTEIDKALGMQYCGDMEEMFQEFVKMFFERK